jgi:hypothetical protein
VQHADVQLLTILERVDPKPLGVEELPALAVVSGFIVVKAALSWVVLNMWASYPERLGAHHWHIELGPVAEWLAAGAAAFAAIVALGISGRDRKDRIAERHDEQKTRARLVQLSVETETSRPAVVVQARNFGPLPVIDIDLVDATWSEHPEARWEPLKSHWVGRNRQATETHRPVLMPSQGLDDTFDTLAYFVIRFMHPTEDRPLAPIEPRTANYQIPSSVRTDLTNVVAKVRFTTADGVRWETSTKGEGSGEPTRL